MFALPGIFLLAGFTTCLSQDTLRIATYNLLNYPGSDATTRNPYFRATLHAMDPDVLVVQEMTSQSGVIQFRDNVLNFGQPATYDTVMFNDGPDTDNSMYYKSGKVVFLGAKYITNSPRRIAEYKFKPALSADTIRIYSLHLKANQEDSLTRFTEATTLRNYLNGLPTGSKFIVAGDFNIYTSSESAFQKLISSETDNDGRCKDPLNAIGTWHNNFAFRGIHTQSPRTRDFGNGTTGGMDDRFDMLLLSSPMESHILLSSYTAYGNDGNHYNDSINEMPNTAVPDSVANGLHYAADHLPVFADFVFGTAAPDTGFTSIASGNWNTPGIWSGGVVPSTSSNTTVAAGTTVTIDGAVSCNTITIGGILQFDATDGRSLTSQGSLTIQSGGEFRSSAAFSSGSTTQAVSIAGNMVNNGTFTARLTGSSSGTRVIEVTFNGSVPATISGSTNPTNFSLLRMNLSSTSQTLTPLVDIGFLGNTANALTLTQGTWVQSFSQTTTPGVNITVDTTAVLAISDGGGLSTGSASLLVQGVLSLSGGTLDIGAGNNRLEVLAGGLAEFSGGSTNILGRLTLTSGTTNISGGTISVNPRGASNLSATSNVFEAASAADISMTGGSLTIVNPKTSTSTGREVKITSGSGAKSFSGGTLYFGDGVSTLAGSDSGFVVESGVSLPTVVLRTGGVAGRNVSTASLLTAQGASLLSGALLLGTYSPGFDLSVSQSLHRTGGVLDVAGRTVNVTTPTPPGPSIIAGGFTGSSAFSELTANNSGGVNLTGDIEVNGTLNIVSGVVNTGVDEIVLGSSAQLAEPVGQPIVGTVTTSRSVVQSVNNSFGGIGVEINAGDASPGTTSVVRRTGTAYTQGFASSIKRSFEITPATNTGLNAQLRFFYDNTELVGQDATTLRLWSSENNGSTWSEQGGVVDTSLHRIEVTALDSLSLWTASDIDNPLQLITVCFDVNPNWNVLSIPVLTPEDSVRQVFPNSTFAYAFGFSTSGYLQDFTMENGTGYWLKFPGSESVCVTGSPIYTDTIEVAGGWNIIGSISFPVDTSSIVEIPDGIRVSDFIGFEGAYSVADTIFPGKAYWVKINAPGALVLTSGGPVPDQNPKNKYEISNPKQIRKPIPLERDFSGAKPASKF